MRNKLVNSPVMYAFGMLAMMIPSTAFSSFYSYFYVEKLGLGIGLATLARQSFSSGMLSISRLQAIYLTGRVRASGAGGHGC